MSRRKSLVEEDSVGKVSFNQDAAERASFEYGIMNRSIFTGGKFVCVQCHTTQGYQSYLVINAIP